MDNSCDGRNFASLQNTWSKKTSLNEGSYNPYPELLFNPTKPINKEKYEEDPSAYSLNVCNRPDGPPAVNGNKISNVKGKENYMQQCCQPTPYVGLSSTWGKQQPYTLN